MNLIICLILWFSLLACSQTTDSPTSATEHLPSPTSVVSVPTVTVPASRWPNIADHIDDAIVAGESSVCTLDRVNADKRRDAALKGTSTQPGMDRDEYPFAVCIEGGTGADIRLVPSNENRSMGGWLGNQIEDLPDGTKIQIAVA